MFNSIIKDFNFDRGNGSFFSLDEETDFFSMSEVNDLGYDMTEETDFFSMSEVNDLGYDMTESIDIPISTIITSGFIFSSPII